jgi:hypothetical protein
MDSIDFILPQKVTWRGGGRMAKTNGLFGLAEIQDCKAVSGFMQLQDAVFW